ncbi:MAG: MarR family winged helix-turn-helix transcriptional regulator [Acidothermaceae bacterium]
MSSASRSVPALLAGALRVYRQEIRADLEEAGFADLPPSGSWALAALAHASMGVAELAAHLDWTKQASSRLADALVASGYATRKAHDDDRRRVVLALTNRGFAASKTVVATTRRLDRRLVRGLTADERDALRAAFEGFSVPALRNSRTTEAPSPFSYVGRA